MFWAEFCADWWAEFCADFWAVFDGWNAEATEATDIKPVERLSWSWRKVKDRGKFRTSKDLSSSLIGGLSIGMLVGQSGGLIKVLIFGLSGALISG